MDTTSEGPPKPAPESEKPKPTPTELKAKRLQEYKAKSETDKVLALNPAEARIILDQIAMIALMRAELRQIEANKVASASQKVVEKKILQLPPKLAEIFALPQAKTVLARLTLAGMLAIGGANLLMTVQESLAQSSKYTESVGRKVDIDSQNNLNEPIQLVNPPSGKP